MRWSKDELTSLWQQTVVWWWAGSPDSTLTALRAAGIGEPSFEAVLAWSSTEAFQAMLKGHPAEPATSPAVAGELEIQAWWTSLMRGALDPVLGLKASELLAKAKGMFTERKEISGQIEVALVAACRMLDERDAERLKPIEPYLDPEDAPS